MAVWLHLTRTPASGSEFGSIGDVFAEGLRPVQIWVPDVRSPEFEGEAHRQSAAVAASRHAQEDQAFVDAISLDDD